MVIHTHAMVFFIIPVNAIVDVPLPTLFPSNGQQYELIARRPRGTQIALPNHFARRLASLWR